MIKAENMRTAAWQNEMIYAYRSVRELLPDTQQRFLLDAQIGFETYMQGAVKVYEKAYTQQYGGGSNMPISVNDYEASLYRQRTIELTDLYSQLSQTSYAFLFPQKVNYVPERWEGPLTYTQEDIKILRKEYTYPIWIIKMLA